MTAITSIWAPLHYITRETHTKATTHHLRVTEKQIDSILERIYIMDCERRSWMSSKGKLKTNNKTKAIIQSNQQLVFDWLVSLPASER